MLNTKQEKNLINFESDTPWCHFKRCNVWNPWIFVTTAGCRTPYLTSVDNSPQPTIFRFFPLQQTEWGRETESNPDSSVLSRKSGEEPTWKLTLAGKDSHRAKHRHWYVDKWNVNIVDRVQRVKSSEELKGERSPIKVCLYFWKLWTNIYLCLMEQLLWCTWENWRLLLLLNNWCILRDLLCQLFCGYVQQVGEGQLGRRAQYVTLTAPTPQADSPH